MAMPKAAGGIKKAKAGHGQGQGQGQGRPGGLTFLQPGRIWLVAAVMSLTLNLALLSLAFFSRHDGAGLGRVRGPARMDESFPICDAHQGVEGGFLEEEKPQHLAPADADEAMDGPQQEVGVRATSGSRPISKDSVINLDHGDPTMFESFWKRVGNRGDILIAGWQTISYFSDATNLCWFLEPEFAHQVRRLHGIVGNAATDGSHIVVGTGSTQLFQAVLYALSPPDRSEPMSVVSSIPYYSSYPAVTDFLRSGLFRWAGDANTFQGDAYIELVCSPNNPDGLIKAAVVQSKAGKLVHDLAYYWPQYTPITEMADHDIMLFTVSKSTGHAGTRIGWALVKDKDVARRMVKFIELNTIGVSKDSQLRAAKIMKVISDAYEFPISGNTEKLFEYGRDIMTKRWKKLREVVDLSSIFSLPEYPSAFCKFTDQWAKTYPAFAWLKCEKVGIEDCEVFLRSHKILTRSGRHFGVDPSYVRVSMLDRDEAFDLFIERLSSFH